MARKGNTDRISSAKIDLSVLRIGISVRKRVWCGSSELRIQKKLSAPVVCKTATGLIDAADHRQNQPPRQTVLHFRY